VPTVQGMTLACIRVNVIAIRCRIWVPYPPLALDQKGVPGICHENHMDLRQRPTYKSDHSKTLQAGHGCTRLTY
jgi:hypothetical protein